MRIDFSEPECSTCYQYRTSGILNTHQEPEPSNVIASSVNSIPVSSEPVQALGHDDSAAIGSIPASSSPPIHSSSSPIRTGPLTNQDQNRNTTSVSTTSSAPPTQALNQTDFGFSAFAGPQLPRTGSIQASTSFSFKTAQSSPSPSLSGNSVDFARSDVGYAPTGVVFGSTPLSVSSVCASTTPKDPFSSYFPGFGVGYLPGSSSNLFGSTASSAHGSIPGFGVKRSFPQPSGYGASTTTTMFPSSSTRNPGYASTPDVEDASKHLVSVSASNAYGKKSHEELRWKDYKQGDKGGSLFPPAHISPFGLTPNAASPPLIFDHPQRTDFEKVRGNMTASVTTCPSSVYGQTNGFPNGVTTTRFPSSSSSSAISSSNPNIGPSSKGSRYPGYVPTPDVDDASKHLVSISASNAYQHKSHEELRWKDYKRGVKGGLLPPARIASPNTASPSPRSISDHPPQRTTFEKTGGNMTASAFSSFPAGVTSSSSSVLGQTNAPFTGFNTTPFSGSSSSSLSSPTTFPAASSTVQRPYEPVVGGSSPASSGCCTACGAASSASGNLTPPSVATSLPGLSSFSASGSFPVMFGTTPAVQAHPTLFGTDLAPQAYPTMFGANLAPQAYPTMFGTTPAVQAYPTTFGTNIAARGTNPALQAYPTMFNTNLGAQGTTPAVQAYPTLFGTNLAARGINPALGAYPTMFGTNLAAQGPTGQAHPAMFGATPTVHAHPAMFGANFAAQGTNLGAQGTHFAAQGRAPAFQAYPMMIGTNLGYIFLPFAAMNLQ